MKNTSNKDSITKELLSYSKDFEKLCLIELERLNKKLELELRIGSIIVPDKALSKVEDPEVNTYKWNVSDTDFLELVAALHYEGTIKRKEGKELTRKELIELFSHLFDMQIKDVEGKLTRATARMDKTPFLDSLKLSFENFAVGKEEKLRKRN